MRSAHCIKCNKEYKIQEFRASVLQDKILICNCGGKVKPDIIFFGEKLPPNFFFSL